jgi:hypothetical protein
MSVLDWLFPHAPVRPARRTLSSTRLTLETLEGRDCPSSSPVINVLSALKIGNTLVTSGTVSDESPGTTLIRLRNAITVDIMANPDGTFQDIRPFAGGTRVMAQAEDEDGMKSGFKVTSIVTPTDAAPIITLYHSWGANKSVTLSGQVVDEYPSGLTVTFSGAYSGSTTTDSNGFFTLTYTASSLGSVTASTVDASSQSSNTPSTTLSNMAPVITSFTYTYEGNGYYLFVGTVYDEFVEGLVVAFDGLATLQSQTANVLADGTFSLYVQLNGTPSDDGLAVATVTDWWDILSDESTVYVTQI